MEIACDNCAVHRQTGRKALKKNHTDKERAEGRKTVEPIWLLAFLGYSSHFLSSLSFNPNPASETALVYLLQRLTAPKFALFAEDHRETYPCPIFSKRVYFFLGSPTLTILPEREKQIYNDCPC